MFFLNYTQLIFHEILNLSFDFLAENVIHDIITDIKTRNMFCGKF